MPATLPSNQLFADLGSTTIDKPLSTPQDYADLAENEGAVETTYLRFSGKYVLKTEHSMFLTSILTGDGFWNTLTQEQQDAEFDIGRIDQRQVLQQKIRTNTAQSNDRQGQLEVLMQRINLYLSLGGPAI